MTDPVECAEQSRVVEVGRQEKCFCERHGLWTNCRHHGVCLDDWGDERGRTGGGEQLSLFEEGEEWKV